MKLINPENSYANNIAEKVGPVINESQLSGETCNWLVELISTTYSEDLDQATLIAQYVKDLGQNKGCAEDYILFRLLLTILGYIHAPGLPIVRNKELEDSILKYIISNYSSDFHLFFQLLIIEKDERLHRGGLAIHIETHAIAIFMLKEKLIDYKRFINLDNVPKALYQLCQAGKVWTLEEYSIEEHLYKFVLSWNFWQFVLHSALPEPEFEKIYSNIDTTFFETYIKNQKVKNIFKFINTYLSNILEISGYQPNTRHFKDSQFAWVFNKQEPYFTLLLDEFNHIQFSEYNLRVLLRAAHIAYRYCSDKIPDGVKKELIFLSQKAIGNYRSSLKDADYTDNTYLSGLATVNEAINFITYFRSPAEAIKQLILLLRNFGEVTINDDLTFLVHKQSENPFFIPIDTRGFPDQEPALKGEWFIAKIEWLISTFFELGDADCRSTREDLANFFGSRLKTKKGIKTASPKNSDLIEPNPIWRVAYLSCIRALRCNPRGKLHQTINFSRNYDPDEDVKKEAKEAYIEIRHNNPLPSSMEKVLTIRRVFWYIRQAYYVSLLGIDSLDTRGAQRTYSKEAERCKARMKK